MVLIKVFGLVATRQLETTFPRVDDAVLVSHPHKKSMYMYRDNKQNAKFSSNEFLLKSGLMVFSIFFFVTEKNYLMSLLAMSVRPSVLCRNNVGTRF